MSYRMLVKNIIMVNRVITHFGISAYALTGVDLEIEGKVDECSGFMIDMRCIRRLFNEIIGFRWDKGVLVEEGEPFHRQEEKVVEVDFNPSLENISEYIYNKMAYEILKRYKVELVSVTAKSELGDIIYKRRY